MRPHGVVPMTNSPSLSHFTVDNLTVVDDVFPASDLLAVPAIPRDLLLIGPVGHGKTHLARALGLQLWRDGGGRVIYLSAQDYIGLQYSREREHQHVLEDAERCPILVVDDLGAEAEIKNSVPRLCALLSAREEHGRGVTIITSNITSQDAIKSQLGDRIASRLDSYSTVIVRSTSGSRRPAKRGAVKNLK